MPRSTPEHLILVRHCVIGQRGTITLPEPILSALGIGVGDTVRFEVGTEQVVVTGMRLIPAKSDLSKLANQRVKQIANGCSTEPEDLKSTMT